jgi:serine protease Do
VRLGPTGRRRATAALGLGAFALSATFLFASCQAAAQPVRIGPLDPRTVLTVPTRAPTPTVFPAPNPPTPEPPRPIPTVAALGSQPRPTSAPVAPTSTPNEAEKLRRTVRSVVRIQTDDGGGTGFVVRGRAGNVVVTNRHVIQDATSIVLITPDGNAYRTTVLQQGRTADLAALQIGSLPFPALGTADDRALRPGDPLYVVGFALGTRLLGDPTITRGVFSGRRFLDGVDHVQTDAAMNHGNSGGPVVNANGDVVGIATRGILGDDGRLAPGLNFALPWSVARDVLDQALG